MRKTLLLIYFIFQVFILSVNAQGTYPIYVTPTLTPPYSLNLSDYSKFGSQKLMITVHANDLNISNLPIKLKITIETVGVTIETPPTIVTTPIYISGGETNILFGRDLEDYFNINNLIFKGYSKDSYKRTGQLPEGFYKFKVEVLHYNSNRIISNQGSVATWIALGKPPVLKLPENNAQLGQFKGMPLSFSWLSSNVGSPVSAGSIQYKFEMWEMRVTSINPNVIAASTPVFHEYTTFNTVYTLYPSTLLMTPGMQYAWRITASDVSGFVPFEQKGQSEIRTFIYKAACDSVTNLTSSYKGRNGYFSWEPEDNHTSFNIEMRNPETNWMSNSELFENKAEFFDLNQGATYEMRVQAVCDGDPDSKSDFSDWRTLTIPKPEPVDTADCPNCSCDDDIPDVELQNFDLRKDLQPGDTIVNKTGTSRFILKTVEDQGNGTYEGIFLFWAEIWKLKFICNYWDLQVNTENVIVNMDFESVYDPQFLVDVDATIDYLDSLAGEIVTLTEDITPDDTISIEDEIITTYVNEGDSVIVIVVDEAGDTTEIVVSDNVDNIEETLLEDEDGNGYIVTRDGDIMGIDEYQNTSGGNDGKIEDYKEEKERNDLSEDITVNFIASTSQKYGFDQYSEEKTSLQGNYPSLNNGYKPAFKSIASFSTDMVGVSNSDNNIIFKDEMGIPALKNGEDLTIRGSVNGSDVSMYAYQLINDTIEKIAGKLNVLSFDEQYNQLYIVPVNGASTPDATSLKNTLNKIYSQAVTRWEVTKIENLADVVFENGNMTHGGSSSISPYNKDQRTIVNAFEEKIGTIEKNAYYLFFVENVQFKERSIAGYMPLQYNIGYIYDNPNVNIVAHELGHGAFNLEHTFSPGNYIAAERSTNNLMDYNGKTELWKHQWELIQSPDKVHFAWLQDESEGEMIQNLAIDKYFNIKEEGWSNYGFLSPIGTGITIPEATHVLFNEDGAVINFVINGKKYYGVHSTNTQSFIGYISEDYKNFLTENQVITVEFENEFDQKKFTGFNYLEKDKTIVAVAKKKYENVYLDCVQKSYWYNQEQSNIYTGIAKPPFIPDFAFSVDWKGSQCSDYKKDGVEDGVGIDVYFALINEITEEQKSELIELANYLTNLLKDKKFAFYGYGLQDFYMSGGFNSEILKYLRDNKIYSKTIFDTQFKHQLITIDFDVIFSTADLWSGIDKQNYNINSTDFIKSKQKGERVLYEYTYDDLTYRKKYMDLGGIIAQGIINEERNGIAPAQSVHNSYEQYVACFGTESAVFAWASFAANSSHDILIAYFANRLVADYGAFVLREATKRLSEKAFKDFMFGALMDVTSNVLANELIRKITGETKYVWADIIKEAIASGLENVINPNFKYKKYADVGLTCISNINIDTYKGLFNNSENDQTADFLSLAATQCLVPVIIGELGTKLIKNIVKNKAVSNNAYNVFKNRIKFDDKNTGELMYKVLDLDNVLSGKSDYTIKLFKEVLSKPNGAKAMDILIDAGYDISKISGKNFERLSNIIAKYGDDQLQGITTIFKNTTDTKRALIFLDNMVNSVDEYNKVIQAISNNQMFKNTLTVNGTTETIESVFKSNASGFDFYYKSDGTKHYFAKIINGEGFYITIEKSGDLFTAVIENILKDVASDVVDDLLIDENIIDNEE